MSRATEVQNRLRPAMRSLRDAEDWARLELRDEPLATRIREVHESLTDDVLRGSTLRRSARRSARLWRRYCMLRGHDPDKGEGGSMHRLRSRQREAA